MVKKTYISPAMLTVQLGTIHIIAESLPVDRSGNAEKTITDRSQILVKETTTDVNLWDKEW
jgi:hypothetical protein